MSKIFMDGGSGRNLIFATTLKAMNISLTNLEATDTSFHGIVPGKPEVPLEKIGLDVIFGTQENYRREMIEFKVVDWPSQYHAILGRLAFACFMAIRPRRNTSTGLNRMSASTGKIILPKFLDPGTLLYCSKPRLEVST